MPFWLLYGRKGTQSSMEPPGNRRLKNCVFSLLIWELRSKARELLCCELPEAENFMIPPTVSQGTGWWQEHIWRLRQLQGQKAFKWEISQTEYLINVFRNRPAILEAYDEELFLLLVEHITVLPGRRLVFRLKNGLELEENGQEVSGV